MPAQAIAVFARAPQPGRVKTRLARKIGDTAAAEFYAAMLRDCLAVAQSAARRLGDCEVFVAHTPDDAFAPGPHSLAPFWNGARLPQGGGDLSERMRQVLNQLHARGARRDILLGSDTPDLPADFIMRALACLTEADLVFGPARDGGFYLIGANAPPLEELFKAVNWSAPDTLERTLANARRLGLSVSLLAQWDDVDEPDDVSRLAKRLEQSNAAPFTREMLPNLR
jgi:rSAM/selenodomain-associated transferase 1